MRIEFIHVKGFGALQERTHQLEAPVTVFYGANEAGKSTLMGFVRAVLFGFPSRANAAERYEPPQGGPHGGTLVLRDHAGSRVVVERYAAGPSGRGSASAGTVRVTLEDGTVGGEELLRSLLGGMSSDLFRSLFAFGLGELQELRTLQSEEISSYLYSAGLGVSGAAIMETERQLLAERDSLFKPRGRSQEIHEILERIDKLEVVLRAGKEKAAQYDSMVSGLDELDRQIAQLDGRRLAAGRELAWQEQCLKASRHWPPLLELRRELAELPAGESFPEDAVARWEALAAERERLRGELDAAQLRASQLEAALQAAESASQPELLAHQAELSALLERSSSYRDGTVRLAELRLELAQSQQALQTLLRGIDARWDERVLASFPATVAGKELVRSFQRRWHEHGQERSVLSAETVRLAEQLRQAEEHKERQRGLVGALQQELDARFPWALELPGGDPQEHVSRLRKHYFRWQQASLELNYSRRREEDASVRSTRSRTRRNSNWPGWALGAVTAVVPVTLWLAGQKVMAPIMFAILLALTLITLFTSIRSNKPSSPATNLGQIEDLHKESLKLEQEWQKLISPLMGMMEVSATASESQLDQWQLAADEWQASFSELARQEEKLTGLLESIEELKRSSMEWKSKLHLLDADGEVLRSEWEDWLQEFELSLDLSPEGALEVFRMAEQGQSLLQNQEATTSKLDALQTDMNDFQDAVVRHLGETAANDPVHSLKRWKESADAETTLQQSIQTRKVEWKELEQQNQLIQSSLDRALKSMDILLQSAGAKDEEQLRTRASQFERMRVVLQEARQIEVALETSVGSERIAKLYSHLESHSMEQLQNQFAEHESHLQANEVKLNELRDQRGRLGLDLERLESGTDHGDKLQLYQEELAALQEVAERWATLSFSVNLLRKAREAYEKERQPAVLQRASEYFGFMTKGVFSRIIAPMGEQRLLAVRGDQVLDTSMLSRGTAEQLYLSMRFALAEEYARKVSLPFVMDDIFVNFDYGRMERCLELLGRISESHQVLLFTCHPHVRDAVSAKISGSQIISL